MFLVRCVMLEPNLAQVQQRRPYVPPSPRAGIVALISQIGDPFGRELGSAL